MDELQRAYQELFREYRERAQKIVAQGNEEALKSLDAEMAQQFLDIVCRYIE